MIQQVGTEWVCSICKKKFGRMENAVMHDFSAHSGDKEDIISSEFK